MPKHPCKSVPPVTSMQELLLIKHAPTEQAERFAQVYAHILKESKHIREPDFDYLASIDVDCLVKLYDRFFLNGMLGAKLSSQQLTSEVSPRLTSAGGKLIAYRNGTFRLKISSHLLFNSFKDGQRDVRVNGLHCTNRLEALMRITEHELIHLIEFLSCKYSNCRQAQFHRLAHDIFGHTDFRHELLTSRETAAADYALRVGDSVHFAHNGEQFTGIIYRITKRATVMVPNPQGLFIDTRGQRYLKFYIPVEYLTKV